jgi:myo-inositol-1-phosphate synthase
LSQQSLRVALVGVGNCASSLVQGVEFYKNADEDDFVPGLMHVRLGGYHVRDIVFSAAFDVSAAKVGKDLAEAVFAPPNNTCKFADVPPAGVTVRRGCTLDGLGKYLSDVVSEAPGQADDVAAILRETGTDVVVSYLPVGSERATEWYAEQALAAGCAFVNCVPVFIASRECWARRFAERGLPLIGDDIKSQVGATIVHRVLTNLFRERGVRLDRTYQLNFGGNTDFQNMLERERLESKKIRMEGTTFGNVPLACELKLEVWDSPNSAGVVIDAVRCAKLALDRGLGGPLIGPSSYLMKSPPRQFTDNEAHERTEAFIRGDETAAGQEPR